MEKKLQTTIVAPTQGYVLACCIGLIERIWSTDQQKRVVRSLALYYGVSCSS